MFNAKYISLDIETTGLDPNEDQIVEIGMIVDNLESPVSELPSLRLLLKREKYSGNAFALSMNHKIILEASREGVSRYEAKTQMIQFIEKYFRDGRITVGGKNLAGFDIPFLKNEFPEVVGWFKHRVLDIGPMFYQLGDTQVPDLKTCLERSKIHKNIEHDALADAEDVIRCIRYKLKVGGT